MEGFAPVRAGSRIAGLASLLFASASVAAGPSRIFPAFGGPRRIARKIQVSGGGAPPLNVTGLAQYQKNQAGLKDGSLIDKARIVVRSRRRASGARDALIRSRYSKYP